jgi:hypothetical protein
MKKKFKLNQLEVNSFVTSMPKNEANTLRGGITIDPRVCDTDLNSGCVRETPISPVLVCPTDLTHPRIC